MRNIAFKWLKKAQVDLKAAKDSLEAGNYEWSCFYEGSDIDLLIIGQLEERLFDRIGKILDLTDLPIELFVYKEKGLMN